RSQLCHFDDLMTLLSSSYRARGHRKQIGAPDEPGAPLFVVLFFALFFFFLYRGGGGNARIAVKRWRKCGGMGFRSARMTMTLIAYFVQRYRVISGVHRWFMYHHLRHMSRAE
ncbi:hypothetical protein ALC62_02087, partial [Cyphomyrmex costatus]